MRLQKIVKLTYYLMSVARDILVSNKLCVDKQLPQNRELLYDLGPSQS